MTDLNVMMREQATLGLQSQLDAAVTAGDTEAARKVSVELAKLAVSAAPKAPPYGDVEIRAELDKQAWFGTDPKKSAKALEFGKTMDPKKFATAEAFAAAIVKAVDEEFKPPAVVKEPPENETDEEKEAREAEEAEAAEAAVAAKAGKTRKTDGPGESDTGATRTTRRSGPWTKITDAPPDIQKEIKRSADKFVSKSATKEQRESFVSKALESHYAAHQRKGKK
jgi:hypothetical protein